MTNQEHTSESQRFWELVYDKSSKSYGKPMISGASLCKIKENQHETTYLGANLIKIKELPRNTNDFRSQAMTNQGTTLILRMMWKNNEKQHKINDVES